LHGGTDASGWDQKIYTNVSESITESGLWSAKEKTFLKQAIQGGQAAVWEYVSEDGEGGHLGKVRNQTAVVLEGGEAGEVGSVSLIYRAELVEGEQTALNLTHVSVVSEGVGLTSVVC